MAFTADAVDRSALAESPNVLEFTTPAGLELAMRPADIQKALDHLKAGKRRIKVAVGQTAPPATAAPAPAREDEATAAALAHPEVARFREVFPDAEVRVVRNLKE
jgi:hypothetical protein